jgi:hypothetical protein
MKYEIIIPAAVWLLTFMSIAAVVHQSSRQLERADARKRAWLASAALALGAAAVPAAIQAIVTDGQAFWAGVPLGFVAAAFFFQSLRGQAPSRPALASFREKSTAVTILAIIGVYGWATWSFLQAPPELPVVFGYLVITSILMAIVMTVSHIILAILRAPEATDERDRIIGWRSSRNGYLVMTIGVWGVLMLVFVGATPGILAYAVLGAFVLAELVRLASELAYSRLDI